MLSPAAAVIVRDLGLAGSIVGRHGFDLALDAKLPVCGDQAGVDYEALLRVAPSHIVTEWGAREAPARLGTLAGENGWKMQDIRLHTLADIAVQTRGLAAFLAPEDADVRAKADAIAAKFETLASGPSADQPLRFAALGRVLVLVGVSPVGALGPRSCHGQIVRGLGCELAIAEGPDYAVLTREDVLKLDPGVMVFLRGAGDAKNTGAAADPFAPLRGLPIAALTRQRTIVIDDPLCQLPATSLVRVAEEIEKRLIEWQK